MLRETLQYQSISCKHEHEYKQGIDIEIRQATKSTFDN